MNRDLALYGLVTNGSEFVFLKLMFEEFPRYTRSHEFVLGRDRDLDRVLQVLQHLAAIASVEAVS